MRFLLLFILATTAASADPAERYFDQVAAFEDATSTGYVVPSGKTLTLIRFWASGADPNVYVSLIWCEGTGSEEIIAATRGEMHVWFSQGLDMNNLVGDGSCTLRIKIQNGAGTLTPPVGGFWEGVEK